MTTVQGISQLKIPETMANVVDCGKLEEFGKCKINSESHNSFCKWHQYTPYNEIESVTPHSMISIVNESRRIYLKPKQQDASYHQIKVEANSTGTEPKFLYLGVAPLQRIIDEMKSITTSEVGIQYDPSAVRSAGLMSYCDYLTGDVGGMEAKIRQQKLQEILYS